MIFAISVVITWVYYFFLFQSWGILLLQILNRNHTSRKEYPVLRITTTNILGMIFLTALISVLNIFFKIDFPIRLLVSLNIAIFYKSLYRTALIIISEIKYLLKNRPVLFCFFTIPVFLLLTSLSMPILTYDTGLYHAQSVKYITEFKLILGLANIHCRLGFNSNLFVLQSALVIIDYKYIINSYLILLLSLNTVFHANKRNKSLFLANIASICFIFLFFFFNINGLSNDVFATILGVILIDLLLTNEKDYSFNNQLPILITSYLITIKLSAVVFGILIIYLLVKNRNKLIYGMLLSALIIAPWLVRNIMISGYLIFPYPQVDLFNLQYKVPKETAYETFYDIKNWARTGTTMSMPFIEWVKTWSSNFQYIDIVSLLSLSLLFLVIFHMIIYNRKNHDFLIYCCIGVVGIFFWFFTAPDTRFGMVYFVYSTYLSTYYIFKNIRKSSDVKIVYTLTLVSYFLISLISDVGIWNQYRNENINYYPEVYTESLSNGISINVLEKGDQCWYTPLPCTYKVNTGLKLIGTTLEDGFKIDK
ncbi:hypothetical protein H6803_02040 [Candidatus Nomurabacteria bacterium]|nr:hypothetical protein [Candidatus Nomurabacteria bacterium]